MSTPSEQLLSYLSDTEARANAATRGPWKSVLNHSPYKIVWINKKDMYSTLELQPNDADFIALARTDIPRLTAALRELVKGMCEIRGDKGFPIETPEEIANYSFARALAILKGDKL